VSRPTGAEILQQVLRSALALEADSPVTVWPTIPEDRQEKFVAEVLRHRVVGVIAPVLESLDLSDPWRDRLIAERSQDVLESMRLQSVAVTVVDALTSAGVRVLVYKGVALAAQTTADPSSRGSGDLDLLIAPQDVPKAHAALRRLGASLVDGYIPIPGSPLWPTARRIGCEAPYRFRSVNLDLHWRIDPTPQIASMPYEELWERRSEVKLGGVSIPTLGVLDSLLITCVHGTKEQWHQWRWVVDAVRQLRSVPTESWVDVKRLSHRTGCHVGLSVGTAIAARLATVPAPCLGGPKAERLAEQAWTQAEKGTAPFGRITRAKQLERLAWRFRTLPSPTSAGSVLARAAWSNLDMAEQPLHPCLVWTYPLMRPYLWARRFKSGRYLVSARPGKAS